MTREVKYAVARMTYHFALTFVFLYAMWCEKGTHWREGYQPSIQILIILSWLISFVLLDIWGRGLIDLIERKLTKQNIHP